MSEIVSFLRLHSNGNKLKPINVINDFNFNFLITTKCINMKCQCISDLGQNPINRKRSAYKKSRNYDV